MCVAAVSRQEHALSNANDSMLKQFQDILSRDNLKADLESK